ncbi:MAG: type II toxin-antitoxin system Phd/YefM family antitoxin [Cyanobacteria bacterium P01_H01_bin.74]
MPEYPTSKARDQLSDLINQAAFGKERVVLTRRGKKLVAIIPIEDLERIEQLEDEEDLRDAQEALAQIARGEEKPIPFEKAIKDLGWE